MVAHESKRRFSASERAALYLAANGKCELCGVELGPGWHGDHVQPWSKGGSTDVVNGQALCPDCNRRKGSKVTELRDWQKNAINKYRRDDREDFLAVACPGAGKTVFALTVARELLDLGIVARVVVVCPTSHLKKQWAQKASSFGIELDYAWDASSGAPENASDFRGMAVTYQAIGSSPALFRRHTRRPTFVILDEIHHAATGNTWGDELRQAFEEATRRLALSGTPFRQDNKPIPFIRYSAGGESLADYSYGYADGLADGVVREVVFPSFEGRLEWIDGDKSISARFEDALAERDRAKRLNTALTTGWIDDVFRDAHEKLREIRLDHPEAGGLVLAKDQAHAKRIADKIERVTGAAPVVAVSENGEASLDIDRYTNAKTPWLVAVRMVSEGVDIPRLRVLVYATNTLTEMFFRQAIGRIVRTTFDVSRQPWPEEQTAYCFVPRDPQLLRFVEAIKEERNHQLEDEIEKALRDREVPESDRQTPIFMPVSGEAEAHNIYHTGIAYTQEEISKARALWPYAANVPDHLLARMMRDAGVEAPVARPKAEIEAPEKTATEKKTILKKLIERTSRQLSYRLGVEFKEVNLALVRASGLKRSEASIQQLEAQLEIVKRWLEGGRLG